MAEIDGDWPEGFIVGQGAFDDFIHVFCALCLHDIAATWEASHDSPAYSR